MSSLAYAALWGFVFAVPWERVIVLPGVSIMTRVTGALAMGLALLAILVSGRFRRWRGFQVWALLFVIWAGIVVWMLGMQTIPKKLYTFVQLFLVVWMVWELAPTAKRQLGLLAAYVLGAYVGALGTLLLYHSKAGAMQRFAAGGGDPNSLAMTLSLGIPMAWYLSMTSQRPLMRWVCRAYLPLALVAIGLTGSRGGMLDCMVSLLIIPMTVSLSPKRLAMSAAMVGLSGALAIAYIPEQLVQRFATTGTEVEDARFGGRFKLWVAGVNAFAQRPLMGYGVATYKLAITPQLGSAAQVAHDSFLSVLVEEGLVGLLLYLLMFLSVYLAILRLPRFPRRFALVLFATLVTAMLPLTWEDEKEVWLVSAMLFGMSSMVGAGLSGAASPGGSRTAPIGRRPPAALSTERLATSGRIRNRDGTD
jgi:O-antigen ligase